MSLRIRETVEGHAMHMLKKIFRFHPEQRPIKSRERLFDWSFIDFLFVHFDCSACLVSQSIVLNSGKNIWISRFADSGESDPWQAFRVSDSPNCPRILSGWLYIVLYTLVGPINCLHLAIALSPAKIDTTIGPLKRKINVDLTLVEHNKQCRRAALTYT